jgi:hypothetical protein
MPELTPPYQLPEDVFDRNALKRCMFNVLTEDLTFHQRIKDALNSAGFRVSRIRKHNFHDVWEIRMERGSAMFEDSYVQIRRRIRRVLKAEQLYSKFEGFEVGFQGKGLVLGFCSKLGAVGDIR